MWSGGRSGGRAGGTCFPFPALRCLPHLLQRRPAGAASAPQGQEGTAGPGVPWLVAVFVNDGTATLCCAALCDAVQAQQQEGLVRRGKSALRQYVESFDQDTLVATAR